MTNVQKQCLLKFLGHYTGDVDGIWGIKSRGATLAFQQDHGLEADGIFGPETQRAIRAAIAGESGWQDIRYFSPGEFACKCGKYCDGNPASMDLRVVSLAEAARVHFGRAATVVSGLRCAAHNRNVGGVENSRHLTGKAIDLAIAGVGADKLLEYLRSLPGLRYAYAINATNVHLDVE